MQPVPEPDLLGDAVADDDRELEIEVQPEPLELLVWHDVAVVDVILVATPVGTVAHAVELGERVAEAQPVLLPIRLADAVALGERVPESVVDAV